MTIIIGADHAATDLKEALKKLLAADGYAIEDVSPTSPEGGDDYPDYALRVAEDVARRTETIGVLICDTGIGMAIAANKVAGAFAALVHDAFGARRAREHNNANILVLAAEGTTPKVALELAQIFLTTPFSGSPRHVRRLAKIAYYDRHHVRPESEADHP